MRFIDFFFFHQKREEYFWIFKNKNKRSIGRDDDDDLLYDNIHKTAIRCFLSVRTVGLDRNMEQRVISRSDLYKEENNKSETSDVINDFPHEELEIVDVVANDDNNDTQNTERGDFEFFPLFADDGLTKVTIETNERVNDISKIEELHGRNESPVEYINRERGKDYYFSQYTDQQMKEFEDAAIDIETLQKYSYPRTLHGRKSRYILDVNEHNSSIDKELLRIKKLKRRRPGQKQRLARKLGKKHEQERLELKLLLKKRFRKRGGKKNRKHKLNPLANAGATATTST